jgi:hypothetical protein
MMAVNAVRCPSVQATELFELAGDRVLKGIRQSGVIQEPRETVRAQILADLLVMGCQASWNFGRGKRGTKIQVKANIKTLLGGNTRSAGGILHENHTAGRGKHAVLETLEGSIGGSGIATPVVGVDYETAAKGRLQTRIRSRQLARAGRLGL